jgi:hypothetical protein
VNSNRGQYYAQIIRAGKLEARPFFFSNFKGTPSQKEHKTIFSSLKISKMALSGQSDVTVLFSAVCYTLCNTYIDFPQSVNSGKKVNFLKFSGVKPFYRARATADCHKYSKTVEIPVSHLTQTENCRKVTLIRQSHL